MNHHLIGNMRYFPAKIRCRFFGAVTLRNMSLQLCSQRYVVLKPGINVPASSVSRQGAVLTLYLKLFSQGRIMQYSSHWKRYSTIPHTSTSRLSSKRPMRKKQPVDDTSVGSVIAYPVAEELLLESLRKAIQTQGLYIIHELPSDAADAFYVKAKYAVNETLREIYFFREGCTVFWNMPEVERREVLKFLQRHCDTPYNMQLVLYESEHMSFRYTESQTKLVDDTIEIQAVEGNETQQVLEKYAFSDAMAQSVKLAVLEASLDQFVSSIEHVTEDLRYGKKISLSRSDVLRRTGELFALRHRINLSSNLLDMPDFYWDRGSLEQLYQKTCNNLIIPRRIKVMNERLNLCCSLTELLTTHLSDAHHTRLEWMIIILILIEVVVELIHYVERYMNRQEDLQLATQTSTDVQEPLTSDSQPTMLQMS